MRLRLSILALWHCRRSHCAQEGIEVNLLASISEWEAAAPALKLQALGRLEIGR